MNWGLSILLVAILAASGQAFRPACVSGRRTVVIAPPRGRTPPSPSVDLRAAISEITNSAEFADATKEEGVLVVVEFQKSHCKPCMRIAPEYEALAAKFQSKGARFYKVDADTGKDSLNVLKENGIRSVPTFQIFDGGKKIDSIQGAHVDEVAELCENWVSVKEKKQEQK